MKAALAKSAAMRLLFPALLLAALLVRFHYLDHRGFWLDEFKTLKAIRMSTLELVRERMTRGHTPAYYLALKGWTAVFGEGEKAVRSLSVVCNLLAMVYLYLIARHAWGRQCALWSALFFSLHQQAIWAAQEARPYAGLMLAAAASVHALMHALETGRAAWWLQYIFWCLCGVLLHVSFPFIIAGQILVVAVWLARRRHWRMDWGLAAISILAITGMLMYEVRHYNRIVYAGETVKVVEISPVKESINIFLGEFKKSPHSWLKYLTLACLVSLTISASRGARHQPLVTTGAPELAIPLYQLVLAWVWAALLGVALLSHCMGGVLAATRYYAVGSGGACLVLALGLTAMRDSWRKHALAAFCVIGLAMSSWQWTHTPGDEVREAIRFVTSRLGDNEIVIFNSAEGWTIADYYGLKGPNIYCYTSRRDREILAALDRAGRQLQRVWFINYREDKSTLSKSLMEAIQTRSNLAMDELFSHARVRCYVHSLKMK